ncbi:MAG: mechanosensitive ion channel [Alphaproteobacteria bacterium]|nr:mechanosensitive ion channel [Alphaproteobacteria bacterium]
MDFFENYLTYFYRNYPYLFWIGGLLLAVPVVFVLFHKVFFPYEKKWFRAYSNKWFIAIEKSRIFRVLPHIMSGIIALFSAQGLPKSLIKQILFHCLHAYIGIAITIFLYRIIKVIEYLMTSDDDAYSISLKGCSQFISLGIIIAGLTVSACLLLGKSPTIFLGSLGAATAILSVVFKDTLVSLVTSIQIALNKLIKKEDFIRVESANIEGYVLDIGLSFIRIRHSDETITILPTHKLFENPVRSWSNLALEKTRQIKKAVLIDQTTIFPLTNGKLEAYRKNTHLKDLIDPKKSYENNSELFRDSAEAMLKKHEKISKKKPVILMFLDPTSHGIPLEIRAFTTEFLWEPHERIQTEILEKVLLLLSVCDLKVYQAD